ncbi:MAG: hypothetical protein V1862_04490 [Methanobacteriota archaeon]
MITGWYCINDMPVTRPILLKNPGWIIRGSPELEEGTSCGKHRRYRRSMIVSFVSRSCSSYPIVPDLITWMGETAGPVNRRSRERAARS